MSQNVRESLTKCDFVIEPPETRQYSTFDFRKADEIFRIGYEETEKRILEMFETVDLNQVIQEKMSRAIKEV
jgi:NTE family protein